MKKKIFLLSVIYLLSFTALLIGENNDINMALKLSNYYLNNGKISKAKQIIKNKLKKNIDDETLWIAYDNIVRFDLINKKREKNSIENKNTRNKNNSKTFHQKTILKKTQNIINKPEENLTVKKSDSTLISTFLDKKFKGDFSIILGPTLEMIEGKGIKFLKNNSGILYLSFNLKRFPNMAEFTIEHKIEGLKRGKIKFLPLKIRINEKDLIIRKIEVKSTFTKSHWNCIDYLKNGTNIIEISLPPFSKDYIIKSVSLKRKL